MFIGGGRNWKEDLTMGLLTAKVVSMCLLGAVSMAVGLLPLVFKRFCGFGTGQTSRRNQILLSALTCFGGGVILATCFTHMLPEVNLFLQNNIDKGVFPDTGLHMAEIFVLCGFFMVYATEELTHFFIHKYMRPANTVQPAPSGSVRSEEMKPALSNGHGGGGGHSHEAEALEFIDGDNATFEATLRGFLVILALSLHAVFEGIALGLTATESSVWYLFFAVASHKFVISFCIGMQFVSSGIKTLLNVIFISTFSLISPIGAGIGIAVSETVSSEADVQTSAVTVLQGLATGTLLYVVFFEVIEKERLKKTNGLMMVAFIVLGALTMTIVQYIEVVASSADEASLPSSEQFVHTQCMKNMPYTTYPIQMECREDGKLYHRIKE